MFFMFCLLLFFTVMMQALVSKYGELKGGEYLDPTGKIAFKFDHIRQEVGATRPAAELDGPLEGLRYLD